MRTLARTLTLPDPRRLPFAIFVGLVASILFGGLIGFAAAGEPVPGTPQRFAVLAPHIGDRGVYMVSIVAETDQGPLVIEEARPLVEFAWHPARRILDYYGELRLVNDLEVGVDGHGYVHSYDATDGHFVAATRFDPAPEDTVHFAADHRELFSRSTEEWRALCGLRNPLQGRVADLSRSVVLFDNCELDEYRTNTLDFYSGRPVAFRARGAEILGGYETVFFSGVKREGHSAQKVYTWFTPQLPYPLRISIEHDGEPGVFDVIRLASFARGAQPLAGPSPPVIGLDAPELEWAPRQPWGPSDEGVDHPFPLSAAFRWARDHAEASTLRDFLQAHPNAYAERAGFSEYWPDNATVVRTWKFEVTDGFTRLPVIGVYQDVRSTYRTVLPWMLPVDVPGTTVSYGFDNRTVNLFGSARKPPLEPRFLPDQLPTVRSLHEVWRAYASPEFRHETPNDWGLLVYCPWITCDEYNMTRYQFSVVTLWAGFDTGRGTNGPFYSSWQESRRSEISVSQRGGVSDVYEAHSRALPSTAGPPAPAVDAPARGLSAVDVGIWSFPTGKYAVATGLLAAMAGLAYWLWPMVKSALAMPFYSRVARPTVLEHPVRAQIHALVEQSPGIHLQEIERRLGRGHGATIHHVRKLVHTGILSESAGPGYTCYFPKGAVDRRVMAAIPYLKSDGARRVLEAVLADPGCPAARVAARTLLTPATVSYHVGRLATAGLIKIERAGAAQVLRAADIAPAVLGGRAA